MGNQGSPFQKYSSAHVSAAQESLLPGHELYPCNSPAHLSSPFSSSEVFYTNTFVPIDVKSDQVSKDSSAYDNHPDYAQHELSAETASSLDGVHFAQGDEQDAEVCSLFCAFFVAVYCRCASIAVDSSMRT